MSLSLGQPRTSSTPPATSSPPALRARRRSWRDPRLAVGVLLVAGSVLAGGQLLASADETVAVLAADVPLAAGQQLERGDLATVRLRFSSDVDADRYLPADAAVDGSVLLRAVGAGELLPRAAVGATSTPALAELPLAVEPGRVPANVRAGAVVDVWAAPGPDGEAAVDGRAGEAELLLEAVPVLAAASDSATSGAGLRQVVVGVAADDEPELSGVVARLGSGLLVVRRPG